LEEGVTRRMKHWTIPICIVLMSMGMHISGCKQETADCRHANAACAEGFVCAESGGTWTCQPSEEGSVIKASAAEKTPANAEAATAKAPSPPKGLSEAQRKRLTREATLNIRKMFDSSVSYYTSEFATRSGDILPRQFPQSAGLTPGRKPTCVDGRPVPYASDYPRWSAPTWQALNFAIDGEHYYRYEYISTGRGTTSRFTARAIGDLDCDGVLSTFERVGVVDRENNVNGGAGLFTKQTLE